MVWKFIIRHVVLYGEKGGLVTLQNSTNEIGLIPGDFTHHKVYLHRYAVK